MRRSTLSSPEERRYMGARGRGPGLWGMKGNERTWDTERKGWGSAARGRRHTSQWRAGKRGAHEMGTRPAVQGAAPGGPSPALWHAFGQLPLPPGKSLRSSRFLSLKKQLHSGKAETQEREILLAPSGPFWDLLAVFSAHSFGVHWGKRDTPRWCGERFRTHGYVFTGANKNDCLLLVKAS